MKDDEPMRLELLYFYELWSISSYIRKQCEDLFSQTHVPKDGHLIQVSYRTHKLIQSILNDAANIKKLITPPERKGRDVSDSQFAVRLKRCEVLHALLDKHLDEMKSVKVRNSLEHFDERLDKLIEALESGNLKSDGVIFYNIIISDRGVIDTTPYPIRLYVTSERLFHNMESSIDINKIYHESLAVEKIVSEVLKARGVDIEDEPGGFMFYTN